MTRQLLPEEELLAKLNEELSRYDECDQCYFVGIVELRGEDDTGCNWDVNTLRCGPHYSEICRPVAERTVLDAKATYNLKR